MLSPHEASAALSGMEDSYFINGYYVYTYSIMRCIIATGSQFLLSVICLLIAGWFVYKYIGRLMDIISNPMTWAAIIPIPVLFTLINIEIRPHYYATLYTNRIFEVYIFILIIFLILLTIFYASFYVIAMDMFRNSQERERMRLLEMQ